MDVRGDEPNSSCVVVGWELPVETRSARSYAIAHAMSVLTRYLPLSLGLDFAVNSKRYWGKQPSAPLRLLFHSRPRIMLPVCVWLGSLRPASKVIS